SNSPLSGIGILVVIGAALLLVMGVKPYVGPDAGKALIAFALFTTAVVFNVAAIANNNLQDLKTGQLVDATPWKQQWALVIGVVAGAFVIPPVLDLVNRAYGFVGAPGAELRPHPLPAPQAGLISSPAKGLIVGEVILGVVISAIVVFSGKDAPLSVVGPAYETAGVIIGGAAFVIIAFVLYRWILRMASARHGTSPS